MKCCAVVDTNVIISALITKNPISPPQIILRAMFTGDIIPLYHQEILDEYVEVMSRKRFHLKSETIQTVINAI